MTNTILVRDVMSKPVTVAKSVPVTDALDKMLDVGMDPLIVVHNDEVVGTISRHKIVEKLGAKHSSEVSPTAIHVSNTVDDDFTFIYDDQEVDVLIPLLQERYKLAVVYDSDNNLIGQVNSSDILSKMIPDGDLASVMERAQFIEAGERMVHLRRRMIDENISRFIVMNDGKMSGIVSETDVAVAVLKFRESVGDRHQEHQVRNILVQDIMTASVQSIEMGSPVSKVVDLMCTKNFSSVPVTEKGKIVGIVTRQSLIQAL
ncbi:CBS domain-containing protein [uncultured Methanospirillum sp.]|uniref:CBS domain-containing protein n=1 Tax=uncultured Methanospirillum sp. TaxID=262503 RepID=UPI0029C89FF3|nr:CBS domain-containing protein [uncultured Methanospirillum sp.]